MSINTLTPVIQDWFEKKGWEIHPHQQYLLDKAAQKAALLIAPTGGGKTLAGFLPSLSELSQSSHQGMHTLYVSPLKALANDIKRNLQTPVDEMGLDIRIEDRTGDTTQTLRKRQRVDPPHILLTTPESLAVLLSYEDAPRIFANLSRVIIDEAHALAEGKRGDQLMLCLSRLQSLRPELRRIGLSATVENPAALAHYIAPHPFTCEIYEADPGPDPDIKMLETAVAPPWSGAGAVHSVPEVLEQIRTANTTLVFINTRAQAEIFFQALWAANEDNLSIGLHHGSLSRAARAKVEAAMVAGKLRAIVCTGSLDLGIDWGNVDLVIQIGAPKNVKRLVQRIGRSNHRYNAPSQAFIVPANRFEIIECQAALEAVRDRDLDGEPRGDGPLDVLCQHILICACAGSFDPNDLYSEVKTAGPYATLTRTDFDDCLDFCATGGFALRAYDKWKRLIQHGDGTYGLRDPRRARDIRLNIGTIVQSDLLKVRFKGRGGKPLGEIEEAFAATLSAGDTFLIGGQVVQYEGLREMTVEVTRGQKKPKIAVFSGTKLAMSTQLSHRLIRFLDQGDWSSLPSHSAEWLDLQKSISDLPRPNRMLVESFKRDDTQYTCFYGFAGRNAMQTLGLLLTRKMEDQGLGPIGFVASDYAVLIWSLRPITNATNLLDAQEMRSGFAEWLGENAVMKRSFRTVAHIAGLIEKNLPGKQKTGRQATFSSDILYDTLRKYDPDHLMLRITKTEALQGLIDFARIEEMLERTKGAIDVIQAQHVTPFAAPLLLEVGKIPIKGQAEAEIAQIESERLMAEAGLNQ